MSKYQKEIESMEMYEIKFFSIKDTNLVIVFTKMPNGMIVSTLWDGNMTTVYVENNDGLKGPVNCKCTNNI